MNTLEVWQKYSVIENEVDALIDDNANMYLYAIFARFG